MRRRHGASRCDRDRAGVRRAAAAQDLGSGADRPRRRWRPAAGRDARAAAGRRSRSGLNTQLPLDLAVQGRERADGQAGRLLRPKRPVVLALVYYECPMLCTQVLNGVASAIGVLKFSVGQGIRNRHGQLRSAETRRSGRAPRRRTTSSDTSVPGRRPAGISSPASSREISALTRRGRASATPTTLGSVSSPTPAASWSRRRRAGCRTTSTASSTRPRDLRLALIEAADRQDRQPGRRCPPVLLSLRSGERQVQPRRDDGGPDCRRADARRRAARRSC